MVFEEYMPHSRYIKLTTTTSYGEPKQMVVNGRLEPQARLGEAISEFAAVLDDRRKTECRQQEPRQWEEMSSESPNRSTNAVKLNTRGLGARTGRNAVAFWGVCRRSRALAMC